MRFTQRAVFPRLRQRRRCGKASKAESSESLAFSATRNAPQINRNYFTYPCGKEPMESGWLNLKVDWTKPLSITFNQTNHTLYFYCQYCEFSYSSGVPVYAKSSVSHNANQNSWQIDSQVRPKQCCPPRKALNAVLYKDLTVKMPPSSDKTGATATSTLISLAVVRLAVASCLSPISYRRFASWFHLQCCRTDVFVS